ARPLGAPGGHVRGLEVGFERGLVAPDLEHVDQAGRGDVLRIAIGDAAILGPAGAHHRRHVRAEALDVLGRHPHRAGDDQAHARSSTQGWASAARISKTSMSGAWTRVSPMASRPLSSFSLVAGSMSKEN